MELLVAVALGALAYLAFRQQRVARDDNNATVNDLDSLWDAIEATVETIAALPCQKPVKTAKKKKGA